MERAIQLLGVGSCVAALGCSSPGSPAPTSHTGPLGSASEAPPRASVSVAVSVVHADPTARPAPSALVPPRVSEKTCACSPGDILCRATCGGELDHSKCKCDTKQVQCVLDCWSKQGKKD